MRFRDRKYWNLLKEIAICQYKLKDQSTFFGFFWSFFHPLLILTVLFLFFHHRLGKDIHHYAPYLLIGIVHFTHFSNATSVSMGTLLGMKQLTSNAILPKEILVIASVLSSSVEFALSLVLCIPIAYLSGVILSWEIILLPFVFLLQLMLVLWVSFLLSSLFVFVRDISHLHQVFLRILFFITPTFYAASLLGDGVAKYIVVLNPLAYMISFTRAVMIDNVLPAWQPLLIFFVLNAFLIFAAFKLFKRYEPVFAERM
jgi:ABC-type polysaccharide/polyol phosphate export permease